MIFQEMIWKLRVIVIVMMNVMRIHALTVTEITQTAYAMEKKKMNKENKINIYLFIYLFLILFCFSLGVCF